MYLARTYRHGRPVYEIRHTHEEGGILKSRRLMDLGPDPSRFIEYPGGNAFYIADAVEDRLRGMGISPAGDDLEDVFWPFVRPDIRHALEHFRGRHSTPPLRREMPANGFHLFDRRRVLYLRTGQMDQTRIARAPDRTFKALAGKSRDEIEQYFLEAERLLKPHEIKSYVFVIFNLQRYFPESFAKTMPQALDQSLVDDGFLRSVCLLHEDEVFWAGFDRGGCLDEYLARYVILFFDSEYGRSNLMEDMVQDWMNRHRVHRPPPRKAVSETEAVEALGVAAAELRTMSRRDLTRLFRKKAREFHPDKGGDHEAFIRLVEAYREFRERKK